MWQSLIVAVVLTIGAFYALHLAYKAFKQENDPCCGCNGCDLNDPKREQMKKNKGYCDKK